MTLSPPVETVVHVSHHGAGESAAPRLASAENPFPVALTGGGSSPAAGKWSALGSPVTLIAGAGTAPTLKNLSNNANKLGNAYDNSLSTNRYQLAKVTLAVRGASAFTSGTTVKLWLLPLTQDGTNYEDGSDSVTPARPQDADFFLRAVATQQYLSADVVLPAGAFKPLLRNEGGQAFTNTDNENVLTLEPYTEVLA